MKHPDQAMTPPAQGFPPMGKPPMGMPPMGMPPMGKPPMDGKPPMGKPPMGWTPPMADISRISRRELDVPYDTQSKAQCLDIYFPEEGDGPFPLLIHIHGGGFAFGDKRDDHMNAYLKFLDRGFAVASLSYRLSGEAKFPAAVLDCRQAVRFLKEQAGRFPIDPEKFCVIGGSAGGNLAAMLAMNVPNGAFPGEEGCRFATQPTVAGAVDQFGPVGFKAMDDQARSNGISIVNHDPADSPESEYLGMPIGEASAAQCAPAEPLTWAGSAMCPLLVQHGTRDHLVPYEQSAELVAGLKAKGLGDKVTFVPLNGADHEDPMFTADENLECVAAFLKRCL